MKRFALNPDCFLVKGAKRGAIYDLSSGHVYSIDENCTDILNKCEQGDVMPSEKIGDYLHDLQELKIGSFLCEGNFIKKIDLLPPEKKLNFIWLELVQDCNQCCIHCYAECCTNNNFRESLEPATRLSLKQWQNIIKEAYSLGCRHIQFTGGEPMLFGQRIFILIKLARELGYDLIEMFTNATLFNESDINLLAKYGVRIATNVYSKRSAIHDKIVKKKGSLNKTVNCIKAMQKKGIKVFLSTILMKQNERYAKETIEFMRELGESVPLKHFDIVRPTGRGKSQDVFSKNILYWSLKTSPIFSKITKESFIKRKYGHSCWWGNMAISSDGLVMPCVMARQEICGDIKKQSLSEIFDGSSIKKMWGLSKDYIKTCRDCEYRYACLDCRPLAKGQSNDLFSKNKNCLYDPYQGLWSNRYRKEVMI